MSLADLLAVLDSADPNQLLVFMAHGVPIRGGYHVTEFKVANVASVTCGGDKDDWAEARIEVMEGHGMGQHMPVGKFMAIADKVVARMPEIVDLPLTVEFGPDHAGLRLYQIGRISVGADAVIVPLEPKGAVCKAAETVSCCGTGTLCCA